MRYILYTLHIVHREPLAVVLSLSYLLSHQSIYQRIWPDPELTVTSLQGETFTVSTPCNNITLIEDQGMDTA